MNPIGGKSTGYRVNLFTRPIFPVDFERHRTETEARFPTKWENFRRRRERGCNSPLIFFFFSLFSFFFPSPVRPSFLSLYLASKFQRRRALPSPLVAKRTPATMSVKIKSTFSVGNEYSGHRSREQKQILWRIKNRRKDQLKISINAATMKAIPAEYKRATRTRPVEKRFPSGGNSRLGNAPRLTRFDYLPVATRLFDYI